MKRQTSSAMLSKTLDDMKHAVPDVFGISCIIGCAARCTVPLTVCGCILTAALSGTADAAAREHRSDRGQPVEIPARPRDGFNFPYFLRLPDFRFAAGRVTVLVEPNNTGFGSDDFAIHRSSAERLATDSYVVRLAKRLQVPLLVPVFPRPRTEWRLYTHALDRDSLEINAGPLARIDLQLVAMIRHAIHLLESAGMDVDQQVIMNGFSASGTFVNRFAFLHPDLVRAAACGGINGMPVLPVSEWNRRELPFPIGIADLGTFRQEEEAHPVPMFIYMGSDDQNDTLPFRDAWGEAEAALIEQVVGKEMIPDRWLASQRAYRAAGYPAKFMTYNGVGHDITDEVIGDLVDFFQCALSK